jgi:kynureninase
MEPQRRGAQQSLRLRRPREQAQRVHRSLNERGIYCDWREPDVIRVAPAPLYNSFADVWDFCDALAAEMSR